MLTSLPNLLTLMRIIVILPIVILFFYDGPLVRWTIFGLYVLAGITDYFDGLAARSMNQVSKLGRFLDPIADKLLVASIILMLVFKGDIASYHVVAALVILLREITVSGLREFLAEVQVGVPVTKLAKWKTTIQLVALGFLVVGSAAPATLHAPLIGLSLLWVAAVLTVVTGMDYLWAGLRHMK
ncbi:CDP-diacylglycerol--glycerol-3-phosphate 3-phosphatidyltransferase [Aestuariispira insulae]|uniref:CDP-diacylglycerol--glycerol-3-phosphate 3-phosphatidyltransferase n=1 Tax=Aestuariispira insulae TaxID=1461337 RepID=A0A3D9HY24_9PROT|nr:CDP-diacylglycerol--glycerol-3-phosphate 3-phosphatidyltransferase [Aestuariispira insulae]RED54320.1 CDP-diacylglycerol--glycerol-3-phosphate 3-phosphatidyltransferase [Aestuariispira insulae]